MKTNIEKELIFTEPLEYRVVCYTNPQGKEYHIHRLEANTYKVTTTTGPWWNRKSVLSVECDLEQTRFFTDGKLLYEGHRFCDIELYRGSKLLYEGHRFYDIDTRNPESLEEAIALIEYHIAPPEEETVYKVEVNEK